MGYTVTKYPQGTFSWADLASKDIAASSKFMCGLLGWTSQDMPTGENTPPYTMFFLGGKAVAGGMPAFDPNMPSFWGSYISVDDVDAMAAKAETLGGKVVMPAMDVMDAGRMVSIMDPTGAVVNLWQAKSHIGAGIVNIVGAMCWNELYTRDVDVAKKFFGELLGWTYDAPAEMGGDYTVIFNNGRMNGGMMKIDPSWGVMPPNWTVYFTVKSIAESVEKVQALGGVVHMQKDISVGKIAMVADPAGARFMILEMSGEPDEWVE